MKWIILFLGILSNASASVLVKISMTPPRKFPSLAEPLATLSNWPFWMGLFLYGMAFLLYAAALNRWPLNVAHPILTAGTIAAVSCFSLFFFNETFYWSTAVGIVFVIIGVVFITI